MGFQNLRTVHTVMFHFIMTICEGDIYRHGFTEPGHLPFSTIAQTYSYLSASTRSDTVLVGPCRGGSLFFLYSHVITHASCRSGSVVNCAIPTKCAKDSEGFIILPGPRAGAVEWGVVN